MLQNNFLFLTYIYKYIYIRINILAILSKVHSNITHMLIMCNIRQFEDFYDKDSPKVYFANFLFVDHHFNALDTETLQ